jgi:hypothetical protein
MLDDLPYMPGMSETTLLISSSLSEPNSRLILRPFRCFCFMLATLWLRLRSLYAVSLQMSTWDPEKKMRGYKSLYRVS